MNVCRQTKLCRCFHHPRWKFYRSASRAFDCALSTTLLAFHLSDERISILHSLLDPLLSLQWSERFGQSCNLRTSRLAKACENNWRRSHVCHYNNRTTHSLLLCTEIEIFLVSRCEISLHETSTRCIPRKSALIKPKSLQFFSQKINLFTEMFSFLFYNILVYHVKHEMVLIRFFSLILNCWFMDFTLIFSCYLVRWDYVEDSSKMIRFLPNRDWNWTSNGRSVWS